MALENFNHKGKGDFTQDVFDLFTETNSEKVYVRFDGTEYLNRAKANLKAGLNLNFPENKYTLLNNTLKINDFDVQADGFSRSKMKEFTMILHLRQHLNHLNPFFL